MKEGTARSVCSVETPEGMTGDQFYRTEEQTRHLRRGLRLDFVEEKTWKESKNGN